MLLRPGDEADPLDGQPAPSVDDGGEPVQRPRELSMTLVRGSCTDVEPCRARIAFDGRTDEDIDYEVRFDYRVGDDLTVDTRNEQITEIIGPRDPLCIQVFAVDGERTSRGSNEVCEMAVPGFGLVEADDVVTPLDLERGQCASLVRGEDWSDGIPWVRPAPCSGVTGRVVALRRPAPEVDPQTAIGLCQTAANNDGNAVGLLPSAYFAPDRDGTSTLSCVVHP